MTLPQELQAARIRLAKERPYLASAAWALQPVVKPGLETLAVDMYWRLYYDPAVLCRWSVEETEGVMYHELCHLLRQHALRMKDFYPRFNNMAADAEINDDLLRERVKLPLEPITPQSIGQPDNLLAEEYYAALVNNMQQKDDKNASGVEQDTSEKNNGQGAGQGSKEVSPSNGQAKAERDSCTEKCKQSQCGGDNQDNKGDRKSGPKKSDDNQSVSTHGDESTGGTQDEKETPRPGSGRCGSCATGQKAPWEDGPPGKESLPGISQTEGELILRDVARQIKEHKKARGRVPGHLVRWSEEKLNPKVNWQKQLAAAIRYAVADTAGASDYSYRRPSRRQGPAGNREIIFPSMRSPIPGIAVIVDTSSSISDTMIAQALAEISGILRSLGNRDGVYVLAVDTAVACCRKIFRAEQVKLAGGGGTDMRTGLDAASKLRPLPQVGIVITDGHTPWPDYPPKGMKVVITVLSGDGTAPVWSRVIRCKQIHGDHN
ncbi:VWA-like domain-containing protein [Dehalobacter sp. DCM]|uniref:vWA domain-containing protein n=1 Tax=Dehalobacter sp. DCM TaxID=2907827 RepID=UPI0030815A6C|nr:VWA-like domain-containing protein [Dehalobacter sp. DCM]